MTDLALDLSDIYELNPVQVFFTVHMFAFICVFQIGPIKQKFQPGLQIPVLITCSFSGSFSA